MCMNAARGHRPIAKQWFIFARTSGNLLLLLQTELRTIAIVQNPAYIRIFRAQSSSLSSQKRKKKSRPRCRRCFLRSCLLLTYEQALIEAHPGYYYCTRDVRNARARSPCIRTHTPEPRSQFSQRKHSLLVFLLWKSIRSPASTASRASRCLLLHRKLE